MAVTPVLKRFEIQVLKDKPGDPPPPAQVPANSTVDFYPQGASVRVAVSGASSPAEITVWHRGTVKVGDKLWPNGDGAQELTVTLPDTDPTKINVTFTGTLSLAQDARLIRAIPMPPDARPKVYNDPSGAVATAANQITTTEAGGGRGACYLRELRFDYVVRITGEAPRVFADADASYVMR